MNRHLSGSERKREKTGPRQAKLEIERKMGNEAEKRRPREDEQDEEDQERTRERDRRHRENIF